MTESHSDIDPATARVLAGIDDPELAARYPSRAHFISAENPNQGEMATRALFSGDPVVLVYPDGHELLITPEQAHGVAGLLILAGVLISRLLKRRKHDGTVLQFPPSARIEARDSAGLRLAA